MASVFQKLNLKDQKEIVILNAPASFEPELASLQGVNVVRDLQSVSHINFSLVFVIQQAQLDILSAAIVEKAVGDAVIWFAYPKGSSKKYRCEFNRDTGWDVLGRAGFEGVRMVAIDDDWSALRFRRVEHIKSMSRAQKRALSEPGKNKPGVKA